MIEQLVDHLRHQEHRTNPKFCDSVDESIRIESTLQHERATQCTGWHDYGARTIRDRGRTQTACYWPKAARGHEQYCLHPYRTVGEHHALGLAGRTTGVG